MNEKSKSTLEKYKLILRVGNYSERTIKSYSGCVIDFLNNHNKDVYHISIKDAKIFLESKIFSSVSFQNIYINAIKLLYLKVLNKKIENIKFERPRKEKRLPDIIDKSHILKSIGNVNNLKHKAILSLAYSVGLRVSEVINLKLSDIDSKRMVINIKQSKGNKDRQVPLTENILNTLRDYYLEFKPKEYLFNGQSSLKYSPTSCNKIVKKYIGSKYHFHSLRHSCFTHLTEQNVDLRAIQKLAGHTNSKTTEIYTQVSKSVLNSLPLGL